MRNLILGISAWLLCATNSVAQPLSYTKDIQPIFTERCVACHACYDSPCQLNLGSGEGVGRGASKLSVYNGGRLKTQDTTRIFVDAFGSQEWKEKGFHDVVAQKEKQVALLGRMLQLGKEQPFEPNKRLPEKLDIGINRVNQCVTDIEFDKYAATVAHGGMPFGVTGLTPEQYNTIQKWLEQNALIDWKAWQPDIYEQQQIAKWEFELNKIGARESLVNRWLFEHLFLAHLYFPDSKAGRFFQVVRSRTPAGESIDIINTRRPNDDPGLKFFYRIRPVPDVIVHKTHITFELNDEKLASIQQLFYQNNWTNDKLPAYGAMQSANPFKTFEAIPAQARYQFMLDNAEYFVRTFIRGPVCRGQIATDVIRDHFWAFFQDPKHDIYVNNAKFRKETTPLLAMPGQFDDLGDLYHSWKKYRKIRNEYEDLRSEYYSYAEVADWAHIWSGNDNALLTIFRQHDSASVRKGLIGDVPQTMWWLDFPLLERTYYELVVNFDVFGNVSHQAQTRLYFDLIRNGAEVNFLRLMPAETRKTYLKSWYQRAGKIKAWFDYTDIDKKTETALSLPEEGAREAFAQQFLTRFDAINARTDYINRCYSGQECFNPNLDQEMADTEQLLSKIASIPAKQLPIINFLPEASILRVQRSDASREIYSIMRNRSHTNVAFMVGESLRLQPEKDTLTIYPEVLSSYPNFIFNVKTYEMPEFIRLWQGIKTQQEFTQMVDRFGIRRTHPAFWFYFHDVAAHIQETQPIEFGVLDMNRYENL